MNYEQINSLLRSNTAIKLLIVDNAPLIISFLFKAFKEENRLSVPENEISALLNDYLHTVNQPDTIYPKMAKAYLADWSQDGTGFLRMYYELGDEPYYELTPATENALRWIEELSKPEFIGTESRLKLLYDILRELSSKTKQDVHIRIQELEDEKACIEKEIEAARMGYFDVLDETQVKERYFNAEATAKRLLADFRQVEQNFRDLDLDFKRKIIVTSKAKGKVLDDLFQQQDYLWQTDQGRSFKAFWEFLRSQAKQQELEELLHEVLELPAVQSVKGQKTTITRIKNNLIEAGDKVNKSAGALAEQLRKYVEHKSFLENKRIHENIIETLKIVSEKSDSFSKNDYFMELDDVVSIRLMTGRDFEDIVYRSSQPVKFKKAVIEDGEASQSHQPLFDQFAINMEELRLNVKRALQKKTQVSLKELLEEHQIKKGMAEIIGYVEIAAKDRKHVYNGEIEEEVLINNAASGKMFKIRVPQIIYCR